MEQPQALTRPASVSIQALKQYTQAADALGLDSAALLEGAGLDLALLQDNEQRIDLDLFERVLLALIEASGHPYFGLYASNFISPSTYASLGLILITAARLRECINLIPGYEALVGDMGTTELREQPQLALQLWHCRVQQPLVRRHLIEAVLSSWYLYGRNMLGLKQGELQGLYLEHPAPGQDLQPYRAVFGCLPEFNSEYSGLGLPPEALDAPLPQANPDLQSSLIEHAQQLLTQLQPNFKRQLQRAMADLLQRQQLSRASLATALGLSERTLQRRLSELGSSYREQADQLRYQLARQLLAGEDSMETIAQRLGFAETRSFFRRFKQWCGQTAGQYRRACRR